MKKIFITILLLLCCFTMLYSGLGLTKIDAAVGTYYSGVENLSGNALLKKLAEISFKKHSTYNTYGDTRNWGMYSDPDPSNPSNTLDYYSRISVKGAWDGGNTWNREHVWPQSLSGGLYSNTQNSTRGAGGDIHHIRPSIPSINESRGNKPFTDFDKITASGSAKYYNNVLVAYQNSNYWEPLDNVKGDTARILMYLYMHYSTENGLNSHSYAGNLVITSVVYGGGGAEKAWDLLVYWNELDPVDDYESNRNEYCASKTGVRNPFIDHPEYADMIWGDGGSTPIDPDKTYNVSYSLPSGAVFNYSDSTNYKNGEKILEPSIAPVLDGYTFKGWYKDSSYNTKWNFSTDKINSNVTLYAKFEINPENLTFSDMFKTLSIKSKLAFNVTETKEQVGEVDTTVSIKEFTAGPGVLGKKDHNLADYIKFNTELFEISYNRNNATKSYISLTAKEIRLYSDSTQNGSSVDIVAKDGVMISEVSSNTQGLEISISEDGKTAKIHNTTTDNEYISLSDINIKYKAITYNTTYSLDKDELYLVFVLPMSTEVYNAYVDSCKTLYMKVNGKYVNYIVSKTSTGYQLSYFIKVTDMSAYYSPEFICDGFTLYINGYSAKSLASRYLANLSSNNLVKKYKSCLDEILA